MCAGNVHSDTFLPSAPAGLTAAETPPPQKSGCTSSHLTKYESRYFADGSNVTFAANHPERESLFVHVEMAIESGELKKTSLSIRAPGVHGSHFASLSASAASGRPARDFLSLSTSPISDR